MLLFLHCCRSCHYSGIDQATCRMIHTKKKNLQQHGRRSYDKTFDSAVTLPPPSPASLVIREPGGAYNKRSTKYRSTKRTSLSFSLYSRLSSERYATGHTQKGTPHTHTWGLEDEGRMIPHSKARDGNFFKTKKRTQPQWRHRSKEKKKTRQLLFFSRNQREEKEKEPSILENNISIRVFGRL